jgi:CubicO group peptidase (beta-lactamase class C family)
MRANAFRIFAAFSIFASAVPLQGQESANKYAERLEPFLNKTLQDQKIPGLAIGVVEAGRLVYSRGFGVMRVGDPSRPVTPQTLFHMASITKPFVATAVMQLVEQGKVDLEAPVTKYLPYFHLKDPRYQEITVRQMLTHTSGMPDVVNYYWNKPEYDDDALDRYVRSLEGKRLRWNPGTKFAYSNMAFEVLGDLVAKVSGKTFEDYVEANILQPVGMTSSTLLLKKADPAKLAAGHTKTSGKVTVVAHYPYNRAHTPSSNLHSNVEDMARWMMINMNHGELDGKRILKASTYDLLWKPAATVDNRRRVGISWFLSEFKGEPVVMHGGGDDGFLTYLIFSPSRKVGVVMMINYDRAQTKKIWETALSMALEQ